MTNDPAETFKTSPQISQINADSKRGSSRISLRNAGQFLNARNGVGHQINLVEDIIPDVLLCTNKFENRFKGDSKIQSFFILRKSA